MTVTSLDGAAARELGGRFSLHPRCGLDSFVPGLAGEVGVLEVARVADAHVALTSRSGEGEAHGWIVRDDWASDRLGLALGRVPALLSDGPIEERVKRTQEICEALVASGAECSLDLINLRIHADDVAALAGAQEAGFRVCDAELVFYADSQITRPPDLPGSGIEVELIRSPGSDAVAGSDRRRLVDRAGAFSRSHLANDPRVPAVAVRSFYEAWSNNAMTGVWGDLLAVARIGGDAVGFYSWVLDRDLFEAAGVEVYGRSWAVVTQEGMGVMRAMTQATHADQGESLRFTECESQVANVAVHRSLQRLGVVTSVQPVYQLHAWTTDLGRRQ